jgi:hypothetical protein
MKTISKLSIALVLTLLLSIFSITVWAAPRMGTVSDPGSKRPLLPLIPVTGGTFEVTMLETCQATKGETNRIKYLFPIEQEFGKAPQGFNYLTDAIKIKLDGECSVRICYPYPKAYEDVNGQIYKWVVGENSAKWDLIKSEISGDPAQLGSSQKSDYQKICTIEKIDKTGIYSLIGEK